MAKKKAAVKPAKKSDIELFDFLDAKITDGEYIFKEHARQRQKDRNISDLEVLDILQGKPKRNRHRNKKKDDYKAGYKDWNYCIEGKNVDEKGIRIIISFEDELIPIITVMWL